ncbi:hypothetical protein LZ31DRAFT_48514 [Colletotrichum somersetense]|nr:hypothetical protein LZ31DRAFT_48514 [Colletotrichum somersetense]
MPERTHLFVLEPQPCGDARSWPSILGQWSRGFHVVAPASRLEARFNFGNQHTRVAGTSSFRLGKEAATRHALCRRGRRRSQPSPVYWCSEAGTAQVATQFWQKTSSGRAPRPGVDTATRYAKAWFVLTFIESCARATPLQRATNASPDAIGKCLFRIRPDNATLPRAAVQRAAPTPTRG